MSDRSHPLGPPARSPNPEVASRVVAGLALGRAASAPDEPVLRGDA